MEKALFDEQARFLKRHNYTYKRRAHYREDLVRNFADNPAVPECLEACAKFIVANAAEEDVTRAPGPASSTTAAQQEQNAMAQDEEELTKWLSIVDDQLDDVSDVTSLPALQGLVERMESQAGRVAANELSAVIEGAANSRLDEVGRCRLKRSFKIYLCRYTFSLD